MVRIFKQAISLLLLLLNTVLANAQGLDTICDVKYEVDNTFEYPNNLVCRLEVERRKVNRVWIGRTEMFSTGFFIRPNVILTNAHNVSSNMWTSVESIKIYPGYNVGETVQPAYTIEGKKNVKKVVVLPKKYAFTKSAKKRYPFDYALIYLDDYKSPNGDSLQLDKVDPLIDDNVFIVGYPAKMFSDSSNHMTRTQGVNTIGQVQYYTSGGLNKDKFTSRRIYFFTCTRGGNSGSPVLGKRGEDIRVVGVQNAAHTGVRITDDVIATIDRWIKLFEEGKVPKHDHFIQN